VTPVVHLIKQEAQSSQTR